MEVAPGIHRIGTESVNPEARRQVVRTLGEMSVGEKDLTRSLRARITRQSVTTA
jgi:hypothetical protein